MEPNKTIEVNRSSLPTSVVTLLRYLLNALGVLLVTKGILPVDYDIQAAIGAIVIVVSTGYGVVKAWRNNEDKKQMEPYAPDAVAKLVS